MKRELIATCAVASLLLVCSAAFAQKAPTPPVVPLDGLDPVALVEGKKVEGKQEFSVTRGRLQYLFASRSNRDKFAAAPERYEVQRNGECMAMPGVRTNAEIFTVHDGKIYAFGTLLCRERFVLSPESFLNPQARADFKPRNVAILVYEGVELLDFAGPGEVFAAAQTIEGRPAFNVYTVAATAKAITSQGFVKVTPRYTVKNSPRPDIIVLPGGNVQSTTRNQRVMRWIESATRESEVTMSVCNGAYLLARAGLLAGKRATTHWGAISGLRTEAPTATVLENVRLVDNGQIVTTAGVSAGIDGALHVVERLLGTPAARLTARYMEYEWKPVTRSKTSATK